MDCVAIGTLPGFARRQVIDVAGISDLHWSPDGQTLESLLSVHGATNIWELPLNGGKPNNSQITSENSSFNWSVDGSRLFIVRGKTKSDVVLIREMKSERSDFAFSRPKSTLHHVQASSTVGETPDAAGPADAYYFSQCEIDGCAIRDPENHAGNLPSRASTKGRGKSLNQGPQRLLQRERRAMRGMRTSPSSLAVGRVRSLTD